MKFTLNGILAFIFGVFAGAYIMDFDPKHYIECPYCKGVGVI